MVDEAGREGVVDAGAADVRELEEEIVEGESLEDLLRKAIKGMSQLWTVFIATTGMAVLAFIVVGVALFIVWNDNEEDNVHSCQRGNSRAADLVSLTEKVQEIAGGPGVSEKIDELAEFGREQFVARDCTGDGVVTSSDYPDGEERAG